MTYGLALHGHDTSTPVTALSSSLIFRGKAALIAQPGGYGYYPADAVGKDITIKFYAPNTNYRIDSQVNNTLPGTYRGYAIGNTINYGGGSCSAGQTAYLRASVTLQKTIGIFTYSIIAPTLPTVFCYSSSPSTKVSLRGIVQNGTHYDGDPIWEIKVSIGFPLGTAESTFLSHVTLYCFSKIVAADFSSNFGIRTYDANGNPTFSADKKVLNIRDYVTITQSTRPANLGDMIYTRTFAPNPQKSVFQLSKPAFLNIDFGRYEWNQFVYAGYSPFGNGCYYHHQYRFIFNQRFITAGVNVNAAKTDLEFGLQAISGSLMFQYVGWAGNRPGAPASIPNYLGIIYENFPITIPIIEGADYD